MIIEYKNLLTKSRFKYLWGSQLLSQVTLNMMNFILLAKLYSETGSSIATSLLWVAYSLPALFFGPIGAAMVDLVSRRKMLMVTNLLQAIVIFAYVFIHSQNIFILYAVVLLYSLLNQFYVPAEAAYLPSTVSKEKLAQANSIFFMTTQASLILGFGFAGLILKLLGFDGTVILCSVFLFAAFVSTSFLEEIKPKKAIPEKMENAIKAFGESILEGYRFIKEHKYVLYPIVLLLTMQASLTIIVISLPAIAADILGISVNYAGISIVVPAGIGAIMGSIFIPRWIAAKNSRKKKIIENALLAIGVAVLALTQGIPYLPVAYRVLVTPLLLILAGFGFVSINIPTLTFLQTVTPPWLLGRVMGNMFFLLTIISLFPVLFSGAIIEIFGIRTLFTIFGLGALLVLFYSKKNGNKFIKDEFT